MFVDEVAEVVRNQLRKLNNLENVKYVIQNPEQKSLNASVVIDIDAPKVTAKLVFWDSKSAQIGAASVENGNILFDYSCELAEPTDAIEHVEKVMALLQDNSSN